ncbi:MAG: 2-phosphosulfolactate phosphatase [Actinobacteria bacterium]|nr:2-phosphosulfolactate phosphatase [Actinomycetota bacterium]
MTADAVRVRGDRRVDVAFTPAELRRTQVAVVVDVLRASSTIAAALAAGYARVLCVGDVEQARRLRGPGRAVAGERGCRRVEGFDFGNSPRAFVGGATGELVLCTTNGTPAILAAVSAAEDVLVASLLNLDAALQAVPARADVTVVCSGTDGRFALEDAYAAGRIVDGLAGARSDAARAAERLATAYGEPHAPLTESADAAVLRASGQGGDVTFCARESVLAVAPRVTAASDGVAVVSDPASSTPCLAPELGETDEPIFMERA